MRPPSSTFTGTASTGRLSHYAGLFFDPVVTDSAWIRDVAELQLPPCDGLAAVVLRGEFRPNSELRGIETAPPALACRVNGVLAGRYQPTAPGPFELTLGLPTGLAHGPRITLHLEGVEFTNQLAWAGRVTGLGPLQRFRGQGKNRQLRIHSLSTPDGEPIFDFSIRLAPYSAAFARRHARVGLNITGFLTADLGVGESARCMVRAADAAGLPSALVALKLNCKNRLGDQTFAARLQEKNPHPVNVVHLDPPASPDLDHHHGKDFRAGKYNVAYWAWELPEFPDAWVPNFAYFDEVWCPSEFVRAAIAAKSPLPVFAMPHAVTVEPPAGDGRARFGLPRDRYLFLAVYDLNSYSERKNPAATIEAFRRSGLAGQGAGLVVKVQNPAGNETDFAVLQAALRDLPDAILLSETLTRADLTLLQSACDCFVSLHRSEGFGLAVAECMALGKPVISTNWSATAEYVTADNGCPVNYTLTTLAANHGPYSRGQTWAEPDVGHAAEWMRRLAADRALGARLGRAAQATIAEKFAPAVIGARYRRRLEAIAAF
ncbi:MAG: glycosyltransferase family 4 protein [Verrucomicrobia bacterium]|nr:glycosyltransferase family 4 protein [Verrucomicrobiota bacterium]